MFLTALDARTIKSPVPKRSIPITIKSVSSQSTSFVNRIATKGINKIIVVTPKTLTMSLFRLNILYINNNILTNNICQATIYSRDMDKGSTIFLRLVLYLTALAAVIGLVWFPQTEGRAESLDLISIYKDPFIVYLYIATIPFFTALYQAHKILGYIDKNKVFSQESVKAVSIIKYCAIVFMGLIGAATAYIFVMSKATNDDGAGAVAIGVITMFASSVLATATAVLQRLLQNAVDMKSENDLTV